MTIYTYTEGNTIIETTDINTIPEGVSYETIEREEVIEELIQVPQEVQLWRIRTILKLLDLEQTVENSLNSLSEPTKTAALYIWNYGTTVERYSNTVLFIQSTLQMTDAQVDDIFIQSQSIQL